MPRSNGFSETRDAAITGSLGGWALGQIAVVITELIPAIIIGGGVLIIGGTMLALMLGPIGGGVVAIMLGWFMIAVVKDKVLSDRAEREAREAARAQVETDASEADPSQTGTP